MKRVIASLLAAPLFALPAAAFGAFPDKPIRIVIPYSAGGPTDAMARILQGPLQQALGATVIVDNVPGAGGAIAALAVLRAPADGYTLFLGNNGPSAVTPLLQKNAAFDPVRDFEPVSLIAKATMVLAISAKVPATDVRSFVAYAKARPNALNYASAGIGSLGHLGSQLFAREAGLQMTHVPYKGQAPTLNALLTNEVQMLLTTPSDAMRGHVAAGKITLIGVTSDEVSALDPKAALVRDTVPGFVLYSWFAFLVRAGTPPEVVARLHQAVNAALETDEVKKRFAALGVVAEGGAAQKVTALVRQDLARWGPIIRDGNIQPE
jgi:tripartite-type tricarboxylate transporter receptor subunit TctC